MEIKDLQIRQGNVEVVATIKDIEEPREFEKFGKPGRVANATIEDGSGSIKLTLWNDQIDKVKVGDKIHITNGYVNEWQGESQLTTGKFGQLEVVGDDETTEPAEETEGKTEEPAGEEAADEAAEESPEEKQEETVEEEVVEEPVEDATEEESTEEKPKEE